MGSLGQGRYEDSNMQLVLVAEEDGICHVAASGCISSSAIAVHADPLKQFLGTGVYERTVLISLEQARVIDSSGVSWLIRSHRRFVEGGGTLVLHTAPPMVRSVFGLLRMDKVFNLADNLAQAQSLVREKQP